jgi:hypothetical protein
VQGAVGAEFRAPGFFERTLGFALFVLHLKQRFFCLTFCFPSQHSLCIHFCKDLQNPALDFTIFLRPALSCGKELLIAWLYNPSF